MPIVMRCSAPGCETLTMGPLCVDHEPYARSILPGRLFVTTPERARVVISQLQGVPTVRRASARPVAAPRPR